MQKKANNPKVTVITVVFNGSKDIEKTIQSVISQSYNNVEYVVIDGASKDDTVLKIKKYISEIDFFISEPDAGIYDAMNKAISYSTGQWICFMNAGDTFYNNNVLSEVFDNYISPEIEIIYGDNEVIYNDDQKRLAKSGDIKNIWRGSQFCHQSVFIDADYHKKNLYKLNYRMAADFEFFYSAHKKNVEFLKIEKCICTYQAGGVSDVKRVDVILEFWRVVDKNIWVDLFYIARILNERFKQAIKNVIS